MGWHCAPCPGIFPATPRDCEYGRFTDSDSPSLPTEVTHLQAYSQGSHVWWKPVPGAALTGSPARTPRGWALWKGGRSLNWEERLPRRGGSLAAKPGPLFRYPFSPLVTACALWTSSFWLGREALRTRIQGCLGQGRCDRVSQTLQNEESPWGCKHSRVISGPCCPRLGRKG